MHYLYILYSLKDNNFYTSTTSDLERRIKEHLAGRNISTSYRRPLRLIGKLTSGAKRPFPRYSNAYENPDSQGMYGESGEYRYGFGPTGKEEYYDFYQDTLCTSMPLTFQAELTVLVQTKDPILMKASEQAKEALIRGDPAAAQQILNNAIKQIEGGK